MTMGTENTPSCIIQGRQMKTALDFAWQVSYRVIKNTSIVSRTLKFYLEDFEHLRISKQAENYDSLKKLIVATSI